MTQVDERLAKVGQNLKKFISESKYKHKFRFGWYGSRPFSNRSGLNMVL